MWTWSPGPRRLQAPVPEPLGQHKFPYACRFSPLLMAMASAFLSLNPTRLSESAINFHDAAPTCHSRSNVLLALLWYWTIFEIRHDTRGVKPCQALLIPPYGPYCLTLAPICLPDTSAPLPFHLPALPGPRVGGMQGVPVV